MTLSVQKVRGVNNMLRFNYDSGGKSIQWVIETDDVDLDILRDIVDTVAPPLAPTIPAIPVGQGWIQPPLFDPGVEHNGGAEAADKAARAEEQRLMNMGSALAQGINMGPTDIPVFNGDAGDELPPVNWNA